MAWGILDGRVRRGEAALVRDVGAGDLGVDEQAAPPPYVERPGDLALERGLGGDGPLVVVAGPRRAGTSRAAARVARAMLGDHVVVGHHDAPDADLAALVARAGEARRRSGAPAALVWRDGAGLTTLDAITPALLAGLPAGVRLVVTVEDTLLRTWFPDPGTGALLVAPGTLVRLEPPEGGTGGLARLRAMMTPVGWTSLLPLALVRAAADARRLDVPGDDALIALARHHQAALGVEVLDARATAAAFAAVARGRPVHGVRLLRRCGGTYVAPTGATVVADGGGSGSWPLAASLVARPGRLVDPVAHDRMARRLLLRGDHDTLVTLVEDGWGRPTPEQAAALAAAHARVRFRSAPAWARTALASSRREDVVAARLVLAGHDVEANAAVRREHYLAVIEEPAARLGLGELDEAAGDDEAARHHFTAALDGSADVAAPAAAGLRRIAERERDRAERRAVEARRTAERRWRVACHEYAHAVAVLPATIASRDAAAAWRWLARLESTDPPAPYDAKVTELRAGVEALAPRPAHHEEFVAELRREHDATWRAELARERVAVGEAAPA